MLWDKLSKLKIESKEIITFIIKDRVKEKKSNSLYKKIYFTNFTIHRLTKAFSYEGFTRLRAYNFLLSIFNSRIFYENFTPSSIANSACTTLRPMHLHSKHLSFFCFIRSLINYDQFNIDLPQNLLFSQMFIRLIDRHHGFEFQFCSSKERRKTLFPFFSFLSSFFSPFLLPSTRFQSVDFNRSK